MDVSACTDYMAFTFLKAPPMFTDILVENKALAQPGERRATGLQGYAEAQELACGALVLTGEKRMGTHAIFGGSALQKTRDGGISDVVLARRILAQGAKMTRIDVTIDLFGCRMTPNTVKLAYLAGRLKTRAKAANEDKGIGQDGHTVYIGSPASDRRLRVYDKNAELHLENERRWTRLELQNRKRWARATANALADAQNSLQVASAALSNFMEWDNVEYNRALALDGPTIQPERVREHDTLSWLTDQVAPAFARYEHDHPTVNVMAIFLQVLADERLALQKD